MNIYLNRFEKRPLLAFALSTLLLLIGLSSVNADPGPYTGMIGLGDGHTCLLQADGSADCYGRNRNGAGQSDDNLGPFKAIASGSFHNCGIYFDDTAACWGEDGNGQISNNPGGTWQQIDGGDAFTCGLRFNGDVECWGKNNLGQAPALVTGPFDFIELGSNHACALRGDGSMTCWGYAGNGQSYDMGRTDGLPAGTYLDRSVGTSHNCWLLADGSAECAGYNFWGQAEPNPGPFVQVVAGFANSCGLDAGGDVTCWGNASTLIPFVEGPFVQIFGNIGHSCGILTDGSLKCWGDNQYGQAEPDTDPFGLLDTDSDGIVDSADNCAVANADQADSNHDGQGDACDPIVTNLTSEFEPVAIDDQPVSATATFSDADDGDAHMAVFDWGDGNTTLGAVDQAANGVSASHTYAEPGVYTVSVTVADGFGAEATAEYEYVVIYDPHGGYITGAGRIYSSAGAYVADPSWSGEAKFGMISRYQRSKNVPTGVTQFQITAQGFNFVSTSFDWLVIDQANSTAIFKGWGEINGGGNYVFTVWATDGGYGGSNDGFRIQISEYQSGGNLVVVYDNGAESTPTAGNITIHTGR